MPHRFIVMPSHEQTLSVCHLMHRFFMYPSLSSSQSGKGQAMESNEKQYTIYIRSTKERIPVSKEEFDAYYHDINIYRIRQQRHGRCVYAAAQGNLQPQCLARTDRIP